MQLHQTQSLVLKTTSYRDKDLVVHFLTKEFGKKTGIFYGARSQRSAYRSMSEPFSLLGIEFSEKENADMITIRSADLLESHVDLRKNYHHFLLASYFTELVHISLIPDPESEAYFELLENALNHLPSKKDITAHKIEFELKLLHLLGVYPQLEHCVICSKPVFQEVPIKTQLKPKKNRLYQIDITHGGVRCETCFSSNSQSILINPGSLMFLNRWSQTLRNFNSLEIRPTRQNLAEINPLIQESFKLHLPRQPKASSLLEKALDGVG